MKSAGTVTISLEDYEKLKKESNDLAQIIHKAENSIVIQYYYTNNDCYLRVITKDEAFDELKKEIESNIEKIRDLRECLRKKDLGNIQKGNKGFIASKLISFFK